MAKKTTKKKPAASTPTETDDDIAEKADHGKGGHVTKKTTGKKAAASASTPTETDDNTAKQADHGKGGVATKTGTGKKPGRNGRAKNINRCWNTQVYVWFSYLDVVFSQLYLSFTIIRFLYVKVRESAW